MIVQARAAFENWNALSKQIQTRIDEVKNIQCMKRVLGNTDAEDQEIDKLVNEAVSETFTFLSLSPESTKSSFRPGSPEELSEWLSNDHKHKMSPTDEKSPLQRPRGFSRTVSCHPRHWGCEEGDEPEIPPETVPEEKTAEVSV